MRLGDYFEKKPLLLNGSSGLRKTGNMAKSHGVKTNWFDAMTFGLASGIAGIAGCGVKVN